MSGFEVKIEGGALVVTIPIIVDSVIVERSEAQKKLTSTLPPRALEVFQLIRRRMCDKEIAAELNISTGTVKAHKKLIFHKLGCASRAELLYKFGYEN